MLKGFRAIFVKELKELIRDPKILVGIIVVPLIMFPALGAVLGFAQQTAIQQAQEMDLLVLDNDGGNWSRELIEYLVDVGANATVVENLSSQQVVDQGLLVENDVSQFIEIPSGFSENVSRHFGGDVNVSAVVNVYGVFNVGGVFSNVGGAGISSVVYSFNRFVAPKSSPPSPSQQT